MSTKPPNGDLRNSNRCCVHRLEPWVFSYRVCSRLRLSSRSTSGKLREYGTKSAKNKRKNKEELWVRYVRTVFSLFPRAEHIADQQFRGERDRTVKLLSAVPRSAKTPERCDSDLSHENHRAFILSANASKFFFFLSFDSALAWETTTKL